MRNIFKCFNWVDGMCDVGVTVFVYRSVFTIGSEFVLCSDGVLFDGYCVDPVFMICSEFVLRSVFAVGWIFIHVRFIKVERLGLVL